MARSSLPETTRSLRAFSTVSSAVSASNAVRRIAIERRGAKGLRERGFQLAKSDGGVVVGGERGREARYARAQL